MTDNRSYIFAGIFASPTNTPLWGISTVYSTGETLRYYNADTSLFTGNTALITEGYSGYEENKNGLYRFVALFEDAGGDTIYGTITILDSIFRVFYFDILGVPYTGVVSLKSSGGGTGDVVGPASATANAIVLFDGTTGKLIKDSATTISTDGTLAANSDTLIPTQKAVKTYADTKQSALGYTPENVANKSIDGTFAANSDTLYPSQKAAKTYADTKQTQTQNLGTITPALADDIPMYDASGTANGKATIKALGNLLAVNLPILAGFQFHNDFINPVTSTTSDGAGFILIVNGSGATCTTVQTPAINRVGIAQTTTGTTSTGRVAMATGNTPVRLSGGEWLYTVDVNVVQLSTATERFALLIGFLGSYTTVNQTNAVYFLYDEGGVSTSSSASANWQCATVSNSSRTITNTTGVAVSAGTFVRLQILVNAAGTSVGFYINGTLVHTETNTIPTAANREVGFGALTVKSAYVAVPALVQYDFINVNCLFTTER